jgi:hypothetical protein
MASKHKKLVDDAKEKITAVFSDRTVDRSQTKESLEELATEVETCLSAMSDDEEDEDDDDSDPEDEEEDDDEDD